MVNLGLTPFASLLSYICMDPDPYGEYGSGSTKLLSTDPTQIRIWIHNNGQNKAQTEDTEDYLRKV